MASEQHGGLLYLLCLPRHTVKKLYELFCENDAQDLHFDERLHQIFGKPPHPFADADKLLLPAPMKEFGRVSVNFKTRFAAFGKLPEYMRGYISKRFPDFVFGPYVDQYGRWLKHEDGDIWSMCINKGPKAERVGFPNNDDVLIIHHIHQSSHSFTRRVVDIGSPKKVTIQVTLDSV